jgi:hypothetical protein
MPEDICPNKKVEKIDRRSSQTKSADVLNLHTKQLHHDVPTSSWGFLCSDPGNIRDHRMRQLWRSRLRARTIRSQSVDLFAGAGDGWNQKTEENM